MMLNYIVEYSTNDLFNNPKDNVFFISIGIFIYFIPSIIATKREHHNKVAITVFNLLLGWTGLGWILALVWSITMTHKNINN